MTPEPERTDLDLHIVRGNEGEFRDFFTANERLISVPLFHHYGEPGRDAALEAWAWAWSNWGLLRERRNPVGYLYRVAQNRAKDHLRRRGREAAVLRQVHVTDRHEDEAERVDVDLQRALARLTPRQRAVVVLVEGYGYTHREVAAALGVRRSTVQNHVERALTKLRTTIKEPSA